MFQRRPTGGGGWSEILDGHRSRPLALPRRRFPGDRSSEAALEGRGAGTHWALAVCCKVSALTQEKEWSSPFRRAPDKTSTLAI